jgi:hypothetical protein
VEAEASGTRSIILQRSSTKCFRCQISQLLQNSKWMSCRWVYWEETVSDNEGYLRLTNTSLLALNQQIRIFKGIMEWNSHKNEVVPSFRSIYCEVFGDSRRFWARNLSHIMTGPFLASTEGAARKHSLKHRGPYVTSSLNRSDKLKSECS